MKKVIIAYFPVIHTGVINFLNKYSNQQVRVFVIGNDILDHLAEDKNSGILALKRDPRIIKENHIVALIKTIRCNNHVGILRSSDLEILFAEFDGIIMPDEDVMRLFAKRYLGEFRGEVVFDQTFLRWDMPKSTAKIPPNCDQVIGLEKASELGLDVYIDEAFEIASKSSDWWRQIGAVMVIDGEIILSAHNRHFPTEYQPYICGDPRSNFDAGQNIDVTNAGHAEALLIAEAARQGISTNGADLFVTTFPCPPCAISIARAGFRRLFFNEGYSKLNSVEILHEVGVEIIHIEK